MPKQAKGTPGPWKASPVGQNTDITISGGFVRGKRRGEKVGDLIATVSCGLSSRQQANAAFIVRACNSHDELVKALTLVVGATYGNRESRIPISSIHEVACAALACVEEKDNA